MLSSVWFFVGFFFALTVLAFFIIFNTLQFLILQLFPTSDHTLLFCLFLIAVFTGEQIGS